MYKTFKYRLYPNKNQERELEICLETHRRLYNAALDGKQLCWETMGVNWSYYEQSAWFTIQRKTNSYFARLNFGSAQQTLRKLDRAYTKFFTDLKKGRKTGHPRFKSLFNFNSFSYGVIGDGCKVVANKLRLQHIGKISVKWHRELQGKVKRATILRENNKWFVCFCVEIEQPTPTTLTTKVGIDLGLTSFVTTNEGDTLGNSCILESKLEELKRRNRKLSRAKRGSNTRKETKRRLTNLHAKIRNSRRDMHHKVARNLVNRYGFIAAESLSVQDMLKTRWLARRISDAGWASFITILCNKAEEAGCTVKLINPEYTSQICSACGQVIEKSLAVRLHRCDCGCVLNRDVNAAINILGRADLEVAKPENILV